MPRSGLSFPLAAALMSVAAASVSAHEITSKSNPALPPAFDITKADVTTDGRLATFIMEVTGDAGAQKPAATGKLLGSNVDAYVWPTKLNSGVAGFAPNAGILALAITAHPDFDDTPLFDENADGDPGNDGNNWHSHWVVLGEDKACAGGLKVLDVAPGKDLLPATAPGLPLALDSPGMTPLLKGNSIRITMPVKGADDVAFDAVIAEMQVNSEGKAPLLCVIGLRKVASGDLSFPGRITRQK